jgi:hypothetical protein
MGFFGALFGTGKLNVDPEQQALAKALLLLGGMFLLYEHSEDIRFTFSKPQATSTKP